MTVAMLISELKKLPPDMKVMQIIPTSDWVTAAEIKVVSKTEMHFDYEGDGIQLYAEGEGEKIILLEY